MDTKHQQLIAELLNNYAGDEAWQDYVSTFEDDWNERDDKELRLSLFRDRGLAVVISGHFNQRAFEWFESSDLPALKGLGSPKDLLLSGSAGINCLRSLLMRLP